jgi:hypothetical protein
MLLKKDCYDLRFRVTVVLDDWASVVQQDGNCSGQECTAGRFECYRLDGYKFERAARVSHNCKLFYLSLQ